MRSHLLTGLLLSASILVAGCDKVQDLQDKIESEVEREQKTDNKNKEKNTQTAENSTNSKTSPDDNGSSTDSTNATKQPTESNRPQNSNSPQFPDLAETERPAAEALARAGGKLKVENGVVTELSLRYKHVETQHMSHIFKLTHLKKLDLTRGASAMT